MLDLSYVRDKIVLVTGAAGTIGAAITENLLPVARAVRCLDHAETDLFFLHQRLRDKGALGPFVGDIRDLDRLRFAMSGVDIVFHTAALKHVGLGEYNPFEVVQTNLHGLNNVIRASLEENVDRVVFTSSDKAVNPTNVMGASKMMGERLVVAANQIRGPHRTVFSAVRFGNVIGSRGSVVPIFAGQLLRGEPLTLTSDQMTRYVMTIDEAAALVLEAGSRMLGGEVFVAKMRALRVLELAQAMCEELVGGRFSAVYVGPRPGEKDYEELLAGEELPRAVELDNLLVVYPPADTSVSRPDYPGGRPIGKPWCSAKDELMTKTEIVRYLRERQILEPYKNALGPRS
jgi:UDP-N-acetylglucosamine 4,6-dehydratase/5-epimerase